MDDIILWLEHWGTLGLFLGNILDSSFLGLLGTMDALIVALCMDGGFFNVLINCLSATSGSVTGVAILYIVITKGKNTFLKKYVKKNSFARVKSITEQYELPLMIFISVAPTPFPFKIFLVSAIFFSNRFKNILIGAIIGRGFRFFFEGFASWYYGEQLKEYYPVVIVVLIVMIIPSYFINRKLRLTQQSEKSPAISI